MNIIHFTHSYLPIIGGTTIRHIELFKNTIHDNVIATTTNLHDKRLNFEIIEGTKVYRIALKRPFNSIKIPIINGLVNRKFLTNEFFKVANQEYPKVIHGHSPEIFASTAFSVCKKLAKKPIFIYDIHQIEFDGQIRTSLHKRINQYISFRRSKKVAQKADYIIVQTEPIKERTAQLYNVNKDKIHVFPMGVDTKMFNPDLYADKRKKLRESLGIKHKIVILYNGSLEKKNGIDFLIKVITTLDENIKSQVLFLFSGKGSFVTMLTELSAKYPNLIKYIGIIPYENMPGLYAACDAQIIPYPKLKTWDYNVPTKLLEALSMNKIIITSNMEGSTSITKNLEQVLVYKSENKDDLISTLYQLVNLSNSNIELNTRDIMIDNYDWDCVRNNLRSFYAEVIK